MMGVSNTGGVWKNRDYRPIARFIWETMQDRVIVERQQELCAIYRMVPFPMTLNDP